MGHAISRKLSKVYFLLALTYIQSFIECKAQYLPKTHYKTQTVQTIADKIAAARGDRRLLPEISLNSAKNAQQVIAQYQKHPKPKVILDEKLYDLCTGFGADSLNALACVVGHELAHFYENHIWTESFSSKIGLAIKTQDTISSFHKSVIEASADAFGMFYGFLAGYETYWIQPDLIQAIYHTYQIPKNQYGYPDLEERLRLSKEKLKEISPLLLAFRAGQFLLLRKEYGYARTCFEFILTHYPGPEIHNNLGLTYIAQAMQTVDKQSQFFALPFEFDARTRLARGVQRGSNPTQMAVDKWLEKAQSAFEKAISMEKYYSSAHINLAGTFSLQGNHAAAIGKINELENLIGKKEMSGNAYLMRGIALVNDGQVERAKPDFENAFSKNAFQIDYNLNLYKQISSDWKEKTWTWLTSWPSLENWINGFWKQSLRSPSLDLNTENSMMEISKIALSNPRPEIVLNISHSNHPVSIQGTSASNGFFLILEIPDYRLSALYSTEEKTKPSPENSPTKNLSPTYTLSGAGSLRYEHFLNEKLIIEMENDRIQGIWKYKIDY